jgi:hypothetical protein
VASRTISVAAVDSTATFPGFNVALSTGATVPALNANGAAFTGPGMPVVVLRQPNGTISLGCSESEYPDTLVSGKLVVTQRGVCARVDRATFGQRHNAAAVAMINTDASFGIFEGTIPGVTIPFLGIRPVDGAALIGADGGTATLAGTPVANPNFRGFAGFSSQGPRRLDSHLKPDLSAPGVSLISAGVGTGTGGARSSGTSMASPHVAGVAALARQAHPDWSQDDIRAAIVNTALSGEVAGFSISRGGGGLVQPLRSVRTSVVAMGQSAETNLSFGFEEFTADFSGSRTLTVRNNGDNPVTFNLSTQGVGGSPHSTSLSAATLTIPARAADSVDLTLNVPAATVGSAAGFREVAGFVTLTPAGENNNNSNSGISLNVPYYLVPRGRSNVKTDLDHPIGPATPDASATVGNDGGARAADADLYAWGLAGTEKGLGPIGLRAVGVQSNSRPGFADDRILVFAVNTFERWPTPNVFRFEILIDTTGSGIPNYKIVGEDLGQLQKTGYDEQGRMGAAVINLGTNTGVIRFVAPAPKDGSTIELPVRASDLGLTAAKPRFSYTASSFVRTESNDTDAITGPGKFNAFVPAISQGQGPTVAPNGTATVNVSINAVEWEQTPALGLMVVTLDNRSGADQAQLIAAAT